jgi:hypothetical protein
MAGLKGETLGDKARLVVQNLVIGVPEGWYSHLSSTLPKDEASLVEWFVEYEKGQAFITEEAYVGLLDRIGE